MNSEKEIPQIFKDAFENAVLGKCPNFRRKFLFEKRITEFTGPIQQPDPLSERKRLLEKSHLPDAAVSKLTAFNDALSSVSERAVKLVDKIKKSLGRNKSLYSIKVELQLFSNKLVDENQKLKGCVLYSSDDVIELSPEKNSENSDIQLLHILGFQVCHAFYRLHSVSWLSLHDMAEVDRIRYKVVIEKSDELVV